MLMNDKRFIFKILVFVFLFHVGLIQADESDQDSQQISNEDLVEKLKQSTKSKSRPKIPHSERVLNSDACWIDSYNRDVKKLAFWCPKDYDKIGLFCYKKCPKNYKSVGLLCVGNKKIPRIRKLDGLSRCGDQTEFHNGLCYEKCPEGYFGSGGSCFRDCPDSKPYPCGQICTSNKNMCTGERLELSLYGVNILAGMLGVFMSSATIMGSSGLLLGLGSFGLAASSLSAGLNSFDLVAELISYPNCYAKNGANYSDPSLLASYKSNYDELIKKNCHKFREARHKNNSSK